MAQQTAVDWLMQQVKSKEWQDMYIWHKEEIFKQAKDIEKEQIINAHIEGQPFHSTISHKAEHYYKDTYK